MSFICFCSRVSKCTSRSTTRPTIAARNRRHYSIYIELDSCDVGFVRAPSDSVSALFSTKGDAMPHVLFFKGGKEIARVKGPQKPLVAKLAKEHAEPIAE